MTTALYQDIWGDTYQVSELADFPTPSAGVITLPAGTSWHITGAVDLGSNRLVAAGACCIYGSSPETCTLTATPGADNAIISATASLTIHKIAITTPSGSIGVSVDGTGGGAAVDWSFVNFYGAGQSVVLDGVSNAIMSTMAWLGANGISVLTEIDTLAVTESLWSLSSSGQVAIDIDSAAAVNRRVRIGNSVMIVASGATGISASDTSITITESLQLERVNFSGAGTFISGLNYLDDEVRFSECRGIVNSTRIGGVSWTGNATVTTIAAVDTPVKAAATSTANALNQRFTHTDNRLTYASAIPLTFYATCTASLTSGNNRQIEVYLYKNGALIPGAIGAITTNGSGRAEGVAAQGLVELEQGDYVELWIANTSNADDITVTEANIIIQGA